MASGERTAPAGTVGFDKKFFEQLIQSRALRFRWHRAVECPCVADGDALLGYDPTCSFCSGTGFRLVSPRAFEERRENRPYYDLTAHFAQGSAETKRYEDLGEWNAGEGMLTLPPDLYAGFRDWFVGLEQAAIHTERLLRADAQDVAVGKIGRTTQAQREAMSFEPVQINYVVGSDNTVYWPGEDFLLVSSSAEQPARMRWLSGRGPVVGDLYSVHYLGRPVWVVEKGLFVAQALVGSPSGARGQERPEQLPNTYRVLLATHPWSRGA